MAGYPILDTRHCNLKHETSEMSYFHPVTGSVLDVFTGKQSIVTFFGQWLEVFGHFRNFVTVGLV
jgi:hypothetical protein